MKQTILFFALGVLVIALTSGCNKAPDTTSTTTTVSTNTVTTNAPATNQ
jgi:hypothetical protein